MRCRQHTPQSTPSCTETHAAVLVPLCNLNDNPGLLLEVRGKLRAHLEKLGGHFLGFLLSISLNLVKFPRWKSRPANESVLHAALREAKEEVGTDVDKIEILGRLGSAQRTGQSDRVPL